MMGSVSCHVAVISANYQLWTHVDVWALCAGLNWFLSDRTQTAECKEDDADINLLTMLTVITV